MICLGGLVSILCASIRRRELTAASVCKFQQQPRWRKSPLAGADADADADAEQQQQRRRQRADARN